MLKFILGLKIIPLLIPPSLRGDCLKDRRPHRQPRQNSAISITSSDPNSTRPSPSRAPFHSSASPALLSPSIFSSSIMLYTMLSALCSLIQRFPPGRRPLWAGGRGDIEKFYLHTSPFQPFWGFPRDHGQLITELVKAVIFYDIIGFECVGFGTYSQ